MKQLFGIAVLIVALSSCNKQKELALQHQVDSLKVEVAVNAQLAGQLQEVGLMLDSIDVSRHSLRTELLEGMSADNYTARLRDINLFVASSQAKLEDLEKALSKSNSAQKRYASIVNQLKQDLESKSRELLVLSEQVARYRAMNDTLSTTVSLQAAEINDQAEQLIAKSQEVTSLEGQVKDLSLQAKTTLADSYFQRALALEEAARRTHFAPKKKKTTQKEALELYKLAASEGKQEAADRIALLEKDI